MCREEKVFSASGAITHLKDLLESFDTSFKIGLILTEMLTTAGPVCIGCMPLQFIMIS